MIKYHSLYNNLYKGIYLKIISNKKISSKKIAFFMKNE